MVSIDKQHWLAQGALQIGKQIQPPAGGVHFTGGSTGKVSSLQDRLAAIDRGEIPASYTASSGQPHGNTLLERLDSIGTGELSPKFGTNEKKFDWTM